MSIAERFVNKPKTQSDEPRIFESNCSNSDVLPSEFEKIKDELFEKIANIPCWAEFDYQKQYTLIEKFVSNKGVTSPAIFAKLLQNSMLGFGIFDKYIKNPDIDGIVYEKNKPLQYLKKSVWISTDEKFPDNKIDLVCKNLLNIAEFDGKNSGCSFRISDYWVELSACGRELNKISVIKITDSFLKNEIAKIRGLIV